MIEDIKTGGMDGREHLQDWLTSLPSFRALLDEVTIQSVTGQFALTAGTEKRSLDWRYLLLCASMLSTSETEAAQDAALRIAQHCLLASPSESERAAAVVVLDQLANQPAIALSEARDLAPTDVLRRVSGPTLFEHWRRSLELTVELTGGSSLQLNRFQRSVWDGATRSDWVSVSAPTSAGKSYVIKKLIEEEARRRPDGMVVYIVPTRALIQEVETDFIHYFVQAGLPDTAVSSMPMIDILTSSRFTVLVLTQERFHLLLTAKPDLQVNFLVVDEAHKLADRQRGILLQQVVDHTREWNQDVQVLFASPHTRNPEVLLDGAPTDASSESICVEQVTVNQNLLWAEQKPRRPAEWGLSLVLHGEATPIGDFALPEKPQPESKRLPYVAYALGEGGGNLVYVDDASKAEKAARQLYELLPPITEPERLKQIAPLIELIEKTVHRRYSLATVLKRGVAFHYGNMPFLMRCEIERLFREGYIDYLVCTSTLLEGVNLPCRNIFVRGPRTGRGNPMSPGDFWNLAGRAGRWGSEFQGNVICVDVKRENLWPDGPPRAKVRTTIEPAVNAVTREFEKFLEWLELEPLAPDFPEEFPQVLNYLIGTLQRDGALTHLYWLKEVDEHSRSRLETAVRDLSEDLPFPTELVARNPGIDPRLMANLLKVFEAYASRPADLLPPDPASDDAVGVFTRVFALIDVAFGPAFSGNEKRQFQLALLTTQWLNGHSLKALIEGRIKALQRRNREVQLPNEIRFVMRDVENYARFWVPKYLSCYVDLLRHFLQCKREADLVEELMDYGVFLEFGVSEDTQLSLISLGLSRTSVIALFEIIRDSSWTPEQCSAWLRDQELDSLDLPVLVRREIVDKFPELYRAAE